MRIYVHDLLFKQALTLFGSKEQRAQWTEDIEKCYVLGCFAMVYVFIFLERGKEYLWASLD